MTDNEKLARWQGLENVRPTRLSNGTIVIIYNSNEIVPDYLNDDAAAMSLLDTLAEKGHEPKLQYYHNIKQWGMMPDEDCGYEWLGDTRREAVVAAVLELIER